MKTSVRRRLWWLFLINLGILFSLYFCIFLYSWLKPRKYLDLRCIFIIKSCTVLMPRYIWHFQWVTSSFCFLLMVSNCKTFSLIYFLKITFWKLKRYFLYPLYILCLFVTWSKFLYSQTIIIRSSSLVIYPCR